MANPEHLKILKRGVEAWNIWRVENPNIVPDLSRADLSEVYLSKANLSRTQLRRAILFKTDLSNANLSGADLSQAKLFWTDLTSTDFSQAKLSRALLIRANVSRADHSDIIDPIMAETIKRTDLRKAKLEDTVICWTDLSNADLSDVNLSHAKLFWTDLSMADLSGANLLFSKLFWTDLSYADLSGANLALTKLFWINLFRTKLAKCILSDQTKFSHLRGAQIGVNGLYFPYNDHAVLMEMIPKGNSMQGSNPDAVVDNLKHARRLHTASLSLAGIALLLNVLQIKCLTLPFGLTDNEVNAFNFATLSVIVSFGLCALVAFFFSSALDGARFINTRESAMKVGHFPWLLSKYEHAPWRKWLSIPARAILCFHPFVYLPFLLNAQTYLIEVCENANGANMLIDYPIFLIFIGLLLFASCIWIFKTSLGFLKPILFDPKTEAERKTDTEKITEAIKEQTTKMDELLTVLKKDDGKERDDQEDVQN